ncbi:MAG TPA: alanine--tRNA ligase, partial [Accumulibacter sp.]|nr:alanine--tRNA ligase [Accumulibacter sp.]
FGDYFKRDAIRYAWELLVEVYRLPADRLWVTVYAEDDEAYDLWTRDVGVPSERVVRIGDNKGARYASDNFWMMGDTGPCGPCTEIFYDHGEEIPGGPPGSPDEDGDRYIEIWNLVFMQFNRDEAGVMHPLPKPSVDTGMGLERTAAVLQHVHSNYEIDLFQRLIAAAARETATTQLDSPSLRVLADHIRACAFLVADGVIPGNEGRGYVLRRIIRRAIRHGYKLGARSAFFHRLLPDLIAEMGRAYPDLAQGQARISEVLRQEETRFFETIEHGMEILESELQKIQPVGIAETQFGTPAVQHVPPVFDGETAFKLHDTFGFPLDLTADVCRERGVSVDVAAFDTAMARQKEQARAAGKFRMAAALDYRGPGSTFHGYTHLDYSGKVLALYRDGTPVDALQEGELGVVVLDETPFYAESGGQVGDRGLINGAQGIFAVEDTQKIQAAVFGHHGVVRTGTLRVGDAVLAKVDRQARARTIRNHSATHLLHHALRAVLGAHVQQKGSLVDADKTRFDFAHTAPLSADEIRRVEILVNNQILDNVAAEAAVMALDDARRSGAMMLFGEKYGDEVRVMTIGVSKELCGGVHVRRSGDIGLFKIVSESGVAAGVRRIEAVTGDRALAFIQQQQIALSEAAAVIKAPALEVPAKLAQVLDNVRAMEKELGRLKTRLASVQGDDLLAQAVDVRGVKVLAARMDGADVGTLRETIDKLRDKLKSAVVLLAASKDDKVTLIAGVTPDLTGRVKAGELVNMVAQQIGGKGGGRADMAQAGGNDPAQLPAALASVVGWVEQRL